MKKSMKNEKGFTLIELLVVVIIVAVLASVGIPLLSANVERARVSEGVAGLGTIRTGLRAAFAENNELPALTTANPVGNNLGLNAGDLTGRYFEDDDFTVTTNVGAATYCVSVSGDDGGAAPNGSEVAGIARSMNEDGDLFEDAACGVVEG